jgi:protein-L-isoaspartate(D-aspartate) O-methyltransferase
VALPIEKEQTISQPYVVALMTQSLLEHPNPQKILEIGTGSGYQAAILSKVFKHVWTIERIEALYLKAKKTLKSLEYDNVHCKLGDGTYGWIDDAPYDGIIVTAAAATIPTALLDQLNPAGGLMVIPVGRIHEVQQLTFLRRNGDLIEERVIEQVTFVPLISDYH